MKPIRLAASLSAAFMLTTTLSTMALAAPVCSAPVKVLAQPRDGLTLLEDSKAEFEKLAGAGFQIDYLNENDRRAKSRADASTVGNYNVYYVDEANVALFASSKWIVPLTDYYPADYDYADFDPGRQKVATYDGKVWFAPLTGGGDLMVYRKDILEAAGIQPPKTLDELIADVPKLTDPDKGMYGIALRGARGSGANVWRWMPFFKAYGGQWFDGDKPAFNSEAAVKATETYLKLFKASAPGTQTGSWDESTGALTVGPGCHPRRIDAAVGYGGRPEDVASGRQDRLPAAAFAADRRRVRPWPRHCGQGQRRRRLEEMRRPVHRLGDVEGE